MTRTPDGDDATLFLGDCLDVLRSLPDASVDAVITDPPYGIDYQSAWRTDKVRRRPKIAGDKRPFVWFLHDAARALAEGGCLLCFCRWDTAEAFCRAIEWSGLVVGAQLVWDRLSHGMGDLKGRPAPRHDTIWFATKGRYRLPGKRPTSVYHARSVPSCHLDHPNQKPLGLMADLVRDYVPEGALVLDPFMGSGSTGVACLAAGRKFLGIELDPAYHAVAARRIADARAARTPAACA